MRIFISYGRQDAAELAARLAAWLRSQGYEPWLDVENGVPIGAPYDIRIETGITESELMIALLSPWSLRPEGFCRNELLYAQWLRKPIIPVRIAPIIPPIQIITLSFVDACTDPLGAFAKLPAIIEQVARTGRMPLQDWPAARPGGEWWSAHRPLDFQEELARHGGTFVGRTWLFARIEQWLKQPSSRLLFLTADAGVGKSALVAQLTARFNVRGVHFCSRSNIETCRPVAWLAGLIYQLSAQFAAYRNRIEQSDAPNWADPPDSLFRTLVADPLRACQAELEVSEPWVFVIDGLDESLAVAEPTLAQLLANSAGRIPSWLRFIVTSRPDQDLVAKFRVDGVRHYHLDAEGKENREDLQAYVQRRVQEIQAEADAVPKVSGVAAGNFLFAKMTLEALGSTDPDASLSLEDIGALPANLGGLYYAMFDKRFADPGTYEKGVLPLLNCLIAARGPVPEQLLLKGAGTDEHGARKGLRELSQFLTRGGAGVQVFHQSLADWLNDAGLSARFAASAADGHRRLAEAGWQEYQAGVDRMSSYSLVHLPTHLAEADRWDKLLELVSRPQLDLIARWVERGEGNQGLACLPGLIRYLEEHNGQPETSAGFATQLARIYSIRGKYDEAEKWLEQALPRTSWRRGRRVRAVALHELGSLHLYRRQPGEAERLYSRALRLCRWGIPAHHDEVAANLVGLATVANATYRFRWGTRLAGRAIREARGAGDLRHVIAAWRLIGAASKMLGRYAEAEAHLQTGLRLSESCGAQLERARLLLLRGHLLYDLAVLEEVQPSKAKPLFEEALAVAERIHDLFCTLDARMGLGLCALAAGATVEAEKHYQVVREYLPTDCHSDLAGGLVIGLAAVAHQRGEWPAAEALYESLLQPEGERGDRSARSKACVGLGAIAWHSGRRDEAERAWEQALRIAATISPARQRLAEHSIRLCQADARVVPR